MNRNINIIIIISLGLLLGLFTMAEVLSSRSGNGIANLTKGITFGVLLLGMFRPSAVPYWVIGLGVFQNMIKRAAVYAGAFSGEDMIYTNAPPAALLAGGVVGMIVHRALKNRLFEKEFLVSFGLASVVFMIMAYQALSGRSGGFGGALNSAVNGGAYMFLIPLMLTFLRDIESCKKLLRWVAICFIPVALYAISQAVFGLNNLDLYYFQSAHTMMYMTGDSGWLGMPGTLHNGVALSAAMLVVIYVLKAYHEGKNGGQNRRRYLIGSKWVFALLLFLAALVIGSGRTQWAGLVLGMLSIPFLTRKWASASAYLGVFAVYIVMVFSAETLMHKMERGELVVYSGSNEYLQKAFVTSTLVDRLIGLNNMRINEDLWTPFGTGTSRVLGEAHKEDSLDDSFKDAFLVRSDDYVHDMVSQMIITFGYIPFGLLVIIGLWALMKTVDLLKRAQKFDYGRMLLWLMAGLIGAGLTGVSSNKTLIQFPSNALFWLIAAIVIVGVLQVTSDEKILRLKQADDDAQDENVA